MEDRNRIILFRVVAGFVDSIILAVFNFVLSSFFYIGSNWFDIIDEVFIMAYFIYFHAKFGQTPGKMFLNIKVFDYKTGMAMSVKQSVIRYVPWIGLAAVEYIVRAFVGYDDYFGWVTALPSFLALVLLLSVFMDANGRGLHDKFAGTITKETPRRKL